MRFGSNLVPVECVELLSPLKESEIQKKNSVEPCTEDEHDVTWCSYIKTVYLLQLGGIFLPSI